MGLRYCVRWQVWLMGLMGLVWLSGDWVWALGGGRRVERRARRIAAKVRALYRDVVYPRFTDWWTDSLYWYWNDTCLVVMHARWGGVVDTLLCRGWLVRRDSQLWRSGWRPVRVLLDTVVVLVRGRERIFRYSWRGQFWLYFPRGDSLVLVDSEKVQNVRFAGGRSGRIAYVKGGNVYLWWRDRGVRLQLTDHCGDTVFSGRADWVYEEELGLVEDALMFTDGGEWLVWYTFHEGGVGRWWFREFVYRDSGLSVYPRRRFVYYPRAGYPPARVTLHAYRLADGVRRRLSLEGNAEWYIPDIGRVAGEGSLVAVLRLDRRQRVMQVWVYDLAHDRAHLFLQEEDSLFLELPGSWGFIDGERLFWLSDRSGVWQGYLCREWGCRALTTSGYNVRRAEFRVVGGGRWLLYTVVTDPSYPIVTQGVLWVGRGDSVVRRYVLRRRGASVDWKVSPGGSYLLVYESSVMVPPSVAMYQGDTSGLAYLWMMADNQWIRFQLSEYEDYLPRVEFVRVPLVASDVVQGLPLSVLGDTLWAMVVRPPQRAVRRRHLPVYLPVYGGPGVQTVRNAWHYLPLLYLPYYSRGVLVARVDGHGTPGRTKAFRQAIYRDLGTLPVEGVRALVLWLEAHEKIDRFRRVIEGWSFGGYLAGLSHLRYPELFPVAIAGAPVTDWRLYDNIYTERYMDLPEENPEGYERSSWHAELVNFTARLPLDFPTYLIVVHGDADENVHVEHTYSVLLWSVVLPFLGGPQHFYWFVYPNVRHGPGGGMGRVIRARMRQWSLCFLLEHPVLWSECVDQWPGVP